jgi:diaminopimelate epimerase
MISNIHSFRKMNGLGNDFVVFDARESRLAIGEAAAQRVADRKLGVGCDQVIMIETSANADVFMRVMNADGTEVAACGNATRCVAALLAQETGRAETVIETRAGLLRAKLRPDGLLLSIWAFPGSAGATSPWLGLAQIRRRSILRSKPGQQAC